MTRKRILVVDDDESLRWVTQAQLQQSGYEVAVAGDGNAALESIWQVPPDLVITDLKMPGMSGLELLRKIREDYPEVIVIIVTAFGTVENAVEAMKAGASDYIMKPVNMDELRLIVNRGLNTSACGKRSGCSAAVSTKNTALRTFLVVRNPYSTCWIWPLGRHRPPRPS